MQKRIILITIISILLIAPAAFAAKVFLNGVDITDVKNKTFTKVKKVEVDASGNIHIDAPQYEVKVLETGGDAAEPAVKGDSNAAGLTKQYFLATQGPSKRVQYKLTVVINGTKRLVIGAQESSVIEEITGWLKKGKNVIQITAEKKVGPEGRLSNAQSDELKLLIGEGHEEKKIVKIDKLKATFKCDAANTKTFTKEYTLVAK
ncbi:MAG: hypothetical protein JXX29_21575 [Deltaproteobacteria bacterium]|nr:hypothetical protein [Deltaproteobacteria bacterium]MBN2674286.1 hypothetical protein [Deltaproteobacteria bacterium]